MIHLNASDERGIDIIRNQIHSFVRTMNLFESGFKFVILDEVDYMTRSAQQALKCLIQEYNDNVKYCLICNYISKIDESLQVRSRLNAHLAERNNKLSINDFIIKSCALALQSVPMANAVWAEDKILQLKPSDIAVAVSVEDGLFTPIIRDADEKSLSNLSKEMKELAEKARSKKLMPSEYQGGSFSISNLGMFGVDDFDAVINPPHGAILAVGRGLKKPIVNDDDTISVANVMSLTLSVDHRVIDGALGAELLQSITKYLEDPVLMLT